MAKENNFDPTAFKQNLPEEVIPGSFRCKGCHEISTGYIFQDKLCKSCALELIAYSRKAQNHIDSIRPTKIYGEMKLKKDPKYISVFDGKELSKREFAAIINLSLPTCRGIIYDYVKSGYIEFSKEKFQGNRIVKLYRKVLNKGELQ